MTNFSSTARLAMALCGLTLAPVAMSAPALAQQATTQQAQPAPKHHSKLKGALVGGAVGAAVGHPKLGAVAGALHQHRKNVKERKAAGGR